MSKEKGCTPERMIEGFESLSEQGKTKVRAHVMGAMFQGCEMPPACKEMMEKWFKSRAPAEGGVGKGRCC